MKRYEEIENEANSLISRFNTRNPIDILKQMDIIVMPFKGKTKLLGMFAVIKNISFIFFNPDISDEMLNMVMAHELGHAILHQEEAKTNHLHEFELFNIENKIETEANLFAAHLLLDDEKIEELAREKFTYDQIAAALNVNVNLLLFKISEINRKCLKFKVHEKGNNRYLIEDKR